MKYSKNNDLTINLTLTEEEFESKFCFCNDCGELIFIDDAVNLDDDYYCDDCVTTCNCCGEVIRSSKVYRTSDSDYDYCEHCYQNDTYRCNDCGTRYRYDDELHYIDGHYYCEDCYQEHEPIVQPYHTMKDSGNVCFYGDENRKDSIYLGFELEVDSDKYFDREEIASHLSDEFGTFFAYENDGSLNYGMEIISQPASLNYHLDMLPKYSKAFHYLLDNNVKSHDAGTCGFHIHLDRKYFGNKEDSAIAKMLYIFEKFRPELMKFSRRTENQCSDWCRSRKQTYDSKAGWIKKAVMESKGYLSYQNRYYAINLTNSSTIECRLWRGTLNLETFEATIKFTARLAELCKKTRAVELAKMTFEDLLGSDKVIFDYWKRINK